MIWGKSDIIMANMKTIIVFLLGIFFIYGCGPSRTIIVKEKQAECYSHGHAKHSDAHLDCVLDLMEKYDK